jgi:hypothetical protein
MGSLPLKRIGGLARAAQILVGLAGLVAIATVPVGRTIVDDAEAYLAGGVDDTEFIESIAPYVLLSVVQGVAVLASAVIVIIWMYRIAVNHRTLHRGGTWGPGWAIGGWFLPPLLYIIPFLMFRELWKASDPDVPIGGDWKPVRVSPLVAAWFVAYSILPLVSLAFQSGDVIGGLGGSERDLAEQIVDGQTIDLVNAVVTALGAATFIAMARQLSDRHRRLSGESAV